MWLKFFGVLFSCWWCTQAAPKRCRDEEPEKRLWYQVPKPKSRNQIEAEEELGQALRELFEKNKISDQESMKIMQKARRCGLVFANPAKDASSLGKADSSKPAKARDTNAARSVKRFLKKNKRWGPFYWAKNPTWMPKTKKIKVVWLPFLLPHEWLSNYMWQPGALSDAMPAAGTFKSQKLAEMCQAWGNPEGSMVPVGLHGDGVPIQGRMNQSTLDFFTLNLPCSDTFQSQRVPICCLETKYNAGEQTCQAICEVIAWSLKKLGEGKYPTERHGGQPFSSTTDKERQKMSGKEMPAKAALIEMRSDWDWNVKWYGAATHNTKVSCCWLCSAKPDTWKALSSQERKDMSLTKAAWFEILAQRGKKINPLFHLPGVTNWTLFPDWMHVCDEGCAALAAGQTLWEILPQYPASNKDERAKLLWEHIQQIYEASKWPGNKRLPKLSLKDFKKDGKAPELDVKAAQCRHFIPVLESLTRENGFHIGTKRQIAIHNVAKYCGKMYAALEKGDKAGIASNGFKFVSQYMALEEFAISKNPDDTHTWRVRPKFHLLQHILDQACKGLHPKDVWNYKDETFAYTMQQLWQRRGGLPTGPRHESEKLLLRWSNCTDSWSLQKAKSSL